MFFFIVMRTFMIAFSLAVLLSSALQSCSLTTPTNGDIELIVNNAAEHRQTIFSPDCPPVDVVNRTNTTIELLTHPSDICSVYPVMFQLYSADSTWQPLWLALARGGYYLWSEGVLNAMCRAVLPQSMVLAPGERLSEVYPRLSASTFGYNRERTAFGIGKHKATITYKLLGSETVMSKSIDFTVR